MGIQFIRSTVFFTLLLGLVGCATYPPSIILPDKATNFKYQYSVNVPKGWDVYEKMPKDIQNQLPSSAKNYLTLAMVNKDSKGIIVLLNRKDSANFDQVLDRPNSEWQEIASMMKTNMEKEADVSEYKNVIKIENLAVTYDNYKSNPRTFKSKAWLEIEADLSFTMVDNTVGYDWFIYPCHKRNFCQTMVLTLSEKEKYETNRPALNQVLESLTMHDIDNN